MFTIKIYILFFIILHTSVYVKAKNVVFAYSSTKWRWFIIADYFEPNTYPKENKEQEKINSKIEELKNEQEELENDIKNKESEKTSLEKEIDKLNGDVITAKGKVKTYPAGQLTAGEDFEVGRYKIYGGSSNFVVYSRFGDLEVNTILGDWGVDEYVYTFNEGDKVEAHSSFKMQPIE